MFSRAPPWQYVNRRRQQPALGLRRPKQPRLAPATTDGEVRGHLCDVQQAVIPAARPQRLAWSTRDGIRTEEIHPTELAELYALPNEALFTAQEAATFLRLKYNTLSWYRCNSGGPAFVRIGPNLIRYRLGDLRGYMRGQPMGEGVQRAAMAMLAARTPRRGG